MKRTLLDTAWYLAAFLIIQYVCMMAAMIGFQTKAITPMVNIVSTLAASIITIALYGWRRWAPLNSIYLNTVLGGMAHHWSLHSAHGSA